LKVIYIKTLNYLL